MTDKKPILCLDFDGVLHRYDSGWKGADVIPDPMTDGAAEFLARAVEAFRVAIFSSRSNQPMGVEAMQVWLRSQLYKRMDQPEADRIFSLIEWPREKPPAMVTLDDRAIQFTGSWPGVDALKMFRTWQQEPVQSVNLGQPQGACLSPGSAVNVLGGVWDEYPDYRDAPSPARPRRHS